MVVLSSGQAFLPTTACHSCPYSALDRCSGPSRPQDFQVRNPRRIGCINAGRQADLVQDLFFHAPETPPESAPILPLPPFIPQVPRGVPKNCAIPDDPRRIYAVSLSSICYNTGRLRYSDGSALRRGLRLAESARLCLMGTASDRLLEEFWANSEEFSSWTTLAKLRLEFATSLSFSVWDEDPRFDQLFNQDRNRVSAEILLRLGIPTIPFIFGLPEDLEDWRRWLAEHPMITTVGILAQFYRRPEEFHHLLSQLKCLRRSLRSSHRFVIVGCATAEKLRSVFRMVPGATVLTAKPIFKGIRGHGVQPGLRFARLPLVPRSDLIRENLLEYESFCEENRAGGMDRLPEREVQGAAVRSHRASCPTAAAGN